MVWGRSPHLGSGAEPLASGLWGGAAEFFDKSGPPDADLRASEKQKSAIERRFKEGKIYNFLYNFSHLFD